MDFSSSSHQDQHAKPQRQYSPIKSADQVPGEQPAKGGEGVEKGTDSVLDQQQDPYYAALSLNPAVAATITTWVAHFSGALALAGTESLLAVLRGQQWPAMGGHNFIRGPGPALGPNATHNLTSQSAYGDGGSFRSRGQGNIGNHVMKTYNGLGMNKITEEIRGEDHFRHHSGHDHEKTKSVLPPQIGNVDDVHIKQLPIRGARCELCKIGLTSLEIVKEHEKGKKHKKNLQKSQNLEIVETGKEEKMPACGDSNPNPKTTPRPENVLNAEKGKNSQPENSPTAVGPHETEIAEIQQPNDKTGKAKYDGQVSHLGNQKHGMKRRIESVHGRKRAKTVDAPKELHKPTKPNNIEVPFSCDLCKVKCYTKEGFDDHLSGKMHRSKQKPPKPKTIMPFICNLCNVRCDAKEVYDDHISGQKHKSKLRRFGSHHQAFDKPLGLQALYPPNSGVRNHDLFHRQHPQPFHSPQGSFPSSGNVPPQNHSAATGAPATCNLN